jgi:hypothetical protein
MRAPNGVLFLFLTKLLERLKKRRKNILTAFPRRALASHSMFPLQHQKKCLS